MAITYRGQASRLNKIESKQNASGFQEKSDPGPRQGVGGEDEHHGPARGGVDVREGPPGESADDGAGDDAVEAREHRVTREKRFFEVV